MSIGVVLTVGVTVVVLSAFMALASGLSAVEREAADPGLFYVVSKGARSEASSMIHAQELSDLQRAISAAGGARDTAPETVQLLRPNTPAPAAPIVLRGFERAPFSTRPDCHLTAGRMFLPGAAEVIAGEAGAAAREDHVRLGPTRLQVVGRFRCASTARRQEVWGDAGTIQRLARLEPGWNLVPVRTDTQVAERLKQAMARTLAGRYTLVSEQTLLAPQTTSTRALIRIGWPLAIGVCASAVVSCLAAMDFAVASSRRRTATLKAIGYNAGPIFFAMLAEAAAVAAVGALAGFAVAIAAFSFSSIEAVGADLTTTSIPLRLTVRDFTIALALGATLGVLGGLIPAARGARTPLQEIR